MTINKTVNGSAAVLKIIGTLDTETSPELEKILEFLEMLQEEIHSL